MKKPASDAEPPRAKKRLRFAPSPPRVRQFTPTPYEDESDREREVAGPVSPRGSELTPAEAREVRRLQREKGVHSELATAVFAACGDSIHDDNNRPYNDDDDDDARARSSEVWNRFEEYAKIDRFEPFHSSSEWATAGEYEATEDETTASPPREQKNGDRGDEAEEPDAWVETEGRSAPVAAAVAAAAAAAASVSERSSPSDGLSTVELLRQLQVLVQPYGTPAHALRALKCVSAVPRRSGGGGQGALRLRQKREAGFPADSAGRVESSELFDRITTLCNTLAIDRGLYETLTTPCGELVNLADLKG